MTELSRKQREIQERDQLILNTAIDIMRCEGYGSLSMEKIANQIEYTRGTIYQHYRNKEEIIAEICIRNLTQMTCLFEWASKFNGNTREQILAIFCAYEFFVTNNSDEFKDFQIIKNESVRDKLCKSTQASLFELETHVVDCMVKIIEKAITNNELVLHSCEPKELVFVLWALSFGTMSLQFSDIPLEKLGIKDPMKIAKIHGVQLLDSHNWLPLSNEYDYEKSEKLITQQINKEMASLVT